MAGTSVMVKTVRPYGAVTYELGKPNWQGRRIPDIRNPSNIIQLNEHRLIDVLILGDDFLTQSEFESGLQSWIDDFYKLKVYDTFCGAFRIRALYRHSSERSSKNRDSYYRVKVTENDKAVDGGSWWGEDSDDSLIFRQRVFHEVDSFSDINLGSCWVLGSFSSLS